MEKEKPNDNKNKIKKITRINVFKKSRELSTRELSLTSTAIELKLTEKEVDEMLDRTYDPESKKPN